MINNYSITDFPAGDNYWLLTWVGVVSIVENDYRISIDFVAIDYNKYKEKPTILTYVLKQPSGHVHRALIKPVGIDFLAFAEIGSVWRHQKCVSSPTYNDKVPKYDIQIKAAEKSQLTKINEVIEAPQRYHSFAAGQNHHKSPCLVITADNFIVKKGGSRFEKVIIPTSELIRLYYCGSGYLLRQLLANGIPNDQVYIRSDTDFNEKTRAAYIHLRKQSYDSDVKYIGRIATCSFAYQSAVDIARHIQAAYANNQPPFLSATFPFTGTTILSLSGKPVLLEENTNRWGLLVYSISRCTAPFPFDTMQFDRDNNNQQTPNPLHEKRAAALLTKMPPAFENESSVGSVNPSDGQTHNVPIVRSTEEKFTHQPQVERFKKDQQQVRTHRNAPTVSTQLDSYSTSDNEPETGFTAPATMETHEENPVVDYAGLELIVEQIRLKNIDCLYQYRSIESGWKETASFIHFDFPKYTTIDRSILKWLLVNPAKDQRGHRKRTRRITIIRIIRGGTGYYLIECEARPGEKFSRVVLHRLGHLMLQHSVLDALLRQLANNKGVWSNCNLALSNIMKHPFYHLKSDTPVKVATRILKYIDSSE